MKRIAKIDGKDVFIDDDVKEIVLTEKIYKNLLLNNLQDITLEDLE